MFCMLWVVGGKGWRVCVFFRNLFYSRLIHSALGLHNTLHIVFRGKIFVSGWGVSEWVVKMKWHRKINPYFYTEACRAIKKASKTTITVRGSGWGSGWNCFTSKGVVVCHTYHKKRIESMKAICLIKPLCLYFFI